MSTVTLPTSMNLSDVKASCLQDIKASIQRFRSDNSTYKSSDIIRIEIPCGRVGAWLHAQDSFLEFKATLDAGTTAGTAGVLALDGTAYTYFKSLRILHGSNVLVNVQNCNRLYNALMDIQVDGSSRNPAQITHGVISETSTSGHGNLYGHIVATAGTISGTYSYAVTLPCSILGSLQEKALPIGWLGSSSLYLELEIEAPNRIFTERRDANLMAGSASTASATPVFTGVTLSDIYYNAKVSQLGSEYDTLLKNSLGDNIVIPATEYKGEVKAISSGASSFSDKFSFNMSSVKFMLWWISNQDTSNGVITLNSAIYHLNQAITQRSCGKVKDYYLSLNGEFFPQQGISMSTSGYTVPAGAQFGAVAYSNLLRCFNQNSDSNGGGVIDLALYTNNDTTYLGDTTNAKRFVAGIDCDRTDNNNSKSMSGLNTQNMNVVLNVNWDAELDSSHNLYGFIMYDCAYVLQDGLLSVRM